MSMTLDDRLTDAMSMLGDIVERPDTDLTTHNEIKREQRRLNDYHLKYLRLGLDEDETANVNTELDRIWQEYGSWEQGIAEGLESWDDGERTHKATEG